MFIRRSWLKFKIYGGFTLFIIIDIILLWFLLNIRAEKEIIHFAGSDDTYASTLLPFVFLLQNFMVALGFWLVYINEEKYELFPENNSELLKYHYFTSDQLLVFIEMVTRAITDKPNSYSKIYVTKEPRPKLFSYQLLGKRVIILNPTILQIAETQELRASLAIDASITGHASFIRIYAQQIRNFYFLPFIIPFVPVIREIIILLVNPPQGGQVLNILIALLFALLFFFIIMTTIRWIHTLLLKIANRSLILDADIIATELVGQSAVINTLLKLGQRREAIEILLDEVRYLEELEHGRILKFEEIKLLKLVQRFPIAQINRDVARALAPEIFLRERFDTLRTIFYCNFQMLDEEIIKNAVLALKKSRSDFIKKWENNKNSQERIPDSVDLYLRLKGSINLKTLGIDPESVITDTEIDILIQEILQKPRKPLFVHEPTKTTLWSVEPPISDRILNIKKIKV